MIQENEIESAKGFIETVLDRLKHYEYNCSTILRASGECESNITFGLYPNLSLWVVGFDFVNDNNLKYGTLHAYMFDSNGRITIPHIEISPELITLTKLGASGKIGIPFELKYIQGKSEEYIFQQSTITDMFSIDTSFCELTELIYTQMCAIHMRSVLTNKQDLL